VAGPFRLIMFDFDGTLVDSQRPITEAMTQAFAAAGLAPPAPSLVRRVVGLPLEVAIEWLLSEAQVPRVAELAQTYRQTFAGLRERPDFHEPLIDGAREAIETLAQPNILLGIATGKNRRGLVASLERHGLSGYFTTLKTADDGPGKPHPHMLLDAMAEVGAEPDDTVLVGDTTFDMEMACNARARALGVSWGYHEADELLAAGALRVIESFRELLPALAGLEEEG
jgi:phosphoglycolate phosphatase